MKGWKFGLTLELLTNVGMKEVEIWSRTIRALSLVSCMRLHTPAGEKEKLPAKSAHQKKPVPLKENATACNEPLKLGLK